jgi:microcystin-dependent protein
MLSMIKRGFIEDPNVVAEFEHMIGRLRVLLSQVIDEDGNLIVADPNLAIVPVGGLMPYAGASAPNGYLLCDGSAISRVTYKSLFDVIGGTYGTGDGSTTFNLPDLRQRFPLGKAASGTGNTLGATGGEIDHTHAIGAHSHSVSINTSSDGSHNHSASTGGAGGHSHGGVTGTNTPTAGGDANHDGVITNFSASHSHSISAEGDHSHSVSVNSDGSHNHSVSGNTGTASATDSGAENPPYQVVNYIIFTGV